jgi:hypothetical protein
MPTSTATTVLRRRFTQTHFQTIPELSEPIFVPSVFGSAKATPKALKGRLVNLSRNKVKPAYAGEIPGRDR